MKTSTSRAALLALCLCTQLMRPIPSLAAEEQYQLKTTSQESAPKYLIREGQLPSGIAIEVMQAITKIAPNIKFIGLEQHLPFARIQTELKRGTLDIFFGLTKTPEREKNYTLLEPPLYTIGDAFFVRADDPITVNGLEDIRKTGDSILAWEGTIQQEYLQQQGLHQAGSAKSIELGLMMLQGGRARFWYGSEMSTTAEIQRLHLEGKIRQIYVNQNNGRYVALNNNIAPELKAKLSAALLTLKQQGELDRIFLKYCADTLSHARCIKYVRK